jgi:hypothetical protein
MVEEAQLRLTEVQLQLMVGKEDVIQLQDVAQLQGVDVIQLPKEDEHQQQPPQAEIELACYSW